MSHTYGSALALIATTVPDHLIEDAEVPILTGPQAQGDLIIFPATPPAATAFEPVPVAGVQIVHGEATGNTHWLHQGFDSPGVQWARVGDGTNGGDLLIGYVYIPGGQTAMAVHTDEHGANGIGAGTYAIHGKREQADEIRRVAD